MAATKMNVMAGADAAAAIDRMSPAGAEANAGVEGRPASPACDPFRQWLDDALGESARNVLERRDAHLAAKTDFEGRRRNAIAAAQSVADEGRAIAEADARCATLAAEVAAGNADIASLNDEMAKRDSRVMVRGARIAIESAAQNAVNEAEERVAETLADWSGAYERHVALQRLEAAHRADQAASALFDALDGYARATENFGPLGVRRHARDPLEFFAAELQRCMGFAAPPAQRLDSARHRFARWFRGIEAAIAAPFVSDLPQE